MRQSLVIQLHRDGAHAAATDQLDQRSGPVQVQALVAAGALTPDQGADLSDKLNEVIAKLNQGQTNADCNQLNAFKNQINGFVNARQLTAVQGQSLVNAANALRTNIGCA